MSFYFKSLKKYAVFEGRARREEFWTFILVNFFLALLLGFVDALFFLDPPEDSLGCLQPLYQLAVFLPSLAVGIRRMHDIDRSGWFYILPIVNLVLACRAGTAGTNRYGPDPKGPGDGTVDLEVFS